MFDLNSKTVTLNSGYIMPINGLGTYSLTGDTCYDSVTSALQSGVRLIDTAYMYHNEEEVGRAIRESGIPREEIFVITKLYPNQFSDPEAVIEQALEKLNIDYIDMMLLHHPGTDDVILIPDLRVDIFAEIPRLSLRLHSDRELVLKRIRQWRSMSKAEKYARSAYQTGMSRSLVNFSRRCR